MQALDKLSPALALVSKPVQDASQFVRDVSGLANVKAEIAALKAENAKLRQWYQLVQTLEAENAKLRGLVNLQTPEKSLFVSGRVMMDSSQAFVKTLLLNVGTYDDVEKGQAVLSDKGLVGRIVETGDNTSRVLLLSDVNSRIPVLIQQSGTHAILAGQNDDLPYLDHIPYDVSLSEGMRVVTSGIGGVLPADLPIGEISRNQDGSFAVKLYSDLENLIYVKAVRKKDPLKIQ